MCGWMKKVRWNKVLLAGFLFLVIATIVHQIEVALTMNYYTMPEYFGVWSKLMMPKAGPPPPSFFLTSLFFSYVTGVVLAAFYDFIKDLLPKNRWQRTGRFTEAVVILSVIFFTLTAYLLFNLPLPLLVWWLASSIIIFFLAAAVFVKVLG